MRIIFFLIKISRGLLKLWQPLKWRILVRLRIRHPLLGTLDDIFWRWLIWIALPQVDDVHTFCYLGVYFGNQIGKELFWQRVQQF